MSERIPSLSSIGTEFDRFKEVYGFQKVVAVVGSSKEGGLSSLRELLSLAFGSLKQEKGKFAVLTGGTKGGVPQLALQVAKDLELPTMGIYPEKGERYVLHHLLDFSLAVPSPVYGNVVWGSETSVLVSFPDIVILAGGEWGTNLEVATIMKDNVNRIKRGVKPITLIVIKDTGGLADGLEQLEKYITVPEGVIKKVDNADALVKTLCETLDN